MYNRRQFLKALGAGTAGALAGQSLFIPGKASAARPPGLPPNIIVFMSDDQGYHDTGIHGSKLNLMPNLEALVAGGVQFTNGYSSGAVCTPTRAGMHTARYQQRFGMDGNQPAAFAMRDGRQMLIASYLRSAGYASCLNGKWHCGWTPGTLIGNHPMDDYGPVGDLRPGYDEFFGFTHPGWTTQVLNWANPYFFVNRTSCVGRTAVENALGYSLGSDGDFFSDAQTVVAKDFITRKKDQPFFLYMFYGTPHTPIGATQRWLDRVPSSVPSESRSYAAMIIAMDDSIGRIVQHLRDNNIEQDTILFYLSDNGGTAEVTATDNFPFEGSKGYPQEGGYHVPFAVRWAGHIDPGVRTTPVISLDIGATAMGVAGVSALPSLPLDGLNLVPWLTGEQGNLAQRYLFWNHSGSTARDWTNYKYLGGNVYNLQTDPEEKTPLASSYTDPDTGETYASIRSRLLSAYNAWAASL